jgi:GH24 family phage-related lysozyme (muramidase)
MTIMAIQGKSKRIGAAALIASAIAIPAEGIRQFAYYDPPGILTVCYGSTTNVEKGKKYSLEECLSRLDSDMLYAITTVERCVPGLPVEVLAAFGDAVYNMGPTIACDQKKSTAARYLYQGELLQACNQLPRWNKARIASFMVVLPGLTKRRLAEKDLCTSKLE